MIDWLTTHWYIIFGVVGGSTFIAFKILGRPADEPLSKRILYGLFPLADPESAERKRITPLSLVLFSIGIVLVAVIAFFDSFH